MPLDEAHDQPLPPPKNSPAWFWVVLVVIAGVVLFFASSSRRRGGEDGATELPGVGSPLPYAQFEPLTGGEKPVNADDFHGKVVLINYWGPWCHFCAKEFPDLVNLEKEFRDNPNFLFVSVSSDGGPDSQPSDLKERTAKFLERYQAQFPTYLDRGGRNRSYLVTLTKQQGFGYPFTLLVDRAGNIAALWPGYDENYGHQMRAAIKQALAAEPPAASPVAEKHPSS